MDEDRDRAAIWFERCAWFALGVGVGILIFIVGALAMYLLRKV